MTRIKHVTTIDMPYKFSTEEITKSADELWFRHMQNEEFREKGKYLFMSSGIESRSAALPLEVIFSDLSFEKKNDLYIEAMIGLGESVLKKALGESNTCPKDIDVIITTSCTGFMIPSVDAYLINKLGLRQDIIRLPVTEMGCAGGTSGLTYAHSFIKANPSLTVALLCIEIPSITFQRNDLSMQNLVSTSIFADGASCVILDGEKEGFNIRDTNMYHFPDSEYLMGYVLKNTGLQIILDKDVPDSINEHFPKIIGSFLEKNQLRIEDIDHYMFHPGGKKIINRVEEFITPFGKDISISKSVLTERGNMSSATIIHILEKTLKLDIKKNEMGYMLAFGPGFSAQALIFDWI